MASRFARSAIGAASIRPSSVLLPRRVVVPPLARAATSHTAAPNADSKTAVAAEDPKKKAQSLIDALPGNSLLSKTAILSSAAGLSVFALSNEYYVVNEETVIAFCLLSVWAAAIKFGGPVYHQWAEAHSNKVKAILTQARDDHKNAVKSRIEDVGQMEGVVDVTKSLFEVSKETAQLEAQAYGLQQKTALAAEAKAVLDSWVRYEGQAKAKQQRELAEMIISKVKRELDSPRVLQQILQQSVADVERIISSKSQ